MKTFRQIREDLGASGPANIVSGIAGSGSENLPKDQREPGVRIKRSKSLVLFKIRRKNKL